MKPSWLIFAFAGGVAIGVVVTRISMEAPVSTTTAASTESPVPPVSQTDTPATDTSADVALKRAAAAPRGETETASAPPEPLAAASSDSSAADIEDASVQRIDAGPVFSEVLARPSVPGFENQLGDAHRALERETRNDGWAYTMESEIQNAMVNETSTGAFRADHIECRATLCEVRLSGKGDQAAAIKRWSENLGTQPFGQRLFLNYSSSISNNERVDSLMIFRKPPSTPQKPR
jgi:hypothetical protein